VTESTTPADAARAARASLLPVLDELQHVVAGPFAGRALEHVARATSALYAAETEPEGSAALGDALRTVLAELPHALEALHEAPPGWEPMNRLLEQVARALSVVHPVAQPVSRRRRPVVLPGGVPSVDRRILAAMGERRQEPGPEAWPETVRMHPETEHRRDTRVIVEVDVGLLSDSNFYTGLAEDVSRGGVFVATQEPLPPGTIVLLFFVLAGGRTLRAEGVVRWLRSAATSAAPGMGVAFTSLGDEERQAIEAFCAERPALFHD
jgi:uncharacterized protein (TIGR02266 family)